MVDQLITRIVNIFHAMQLKYRFETDEDSTEMHRVINFTICFYVVEEDVTITAFANVQRNIYYLSPLPSGGSLLCDR